MSNHNFVVRNLCPACGSTAMETRYHRSFDSPDITNYLTEFYGSQGGVEFESLRGANYDLRKCLECGCVFQNEILNDEYMERLYDAWIDPDFAKENNRPTSLNEASYLAQEIMQVISYFGRPASSLKFLDFGMGWAEWSLMAKAFGCASYGADLSIERVAHAKANGIAVVDLDEIEGQDFDFINTEQVFEHIPNPLNTLQHLCRSLRPGGMIKISVPTAYDIDRRLRRMDWTAPKHTKYSLNPVAPLEHINCFQRTSLVRMAQKAGLSETRIPIRLQYQHSAWCSARQAIKSALRPIYRDLLKRQNCVFFKKP